MGATIAADVENKVRSIPGVGEVNVALVWDPPWNQAMMTEAAKLQLGLM
jgi:metal-sulfur cluster biosynthetic enzyme